MRQKIAILLFALCATVSANAQVTVGDFTYNFYTNNGQAYVDAYTGTDTEITIPGTITYDKDGTETTTEVRGISATAFQGNTTIEKIHIEYYTPVGYYFTLPANAFKGCTALNTFNYATTTAATGTLIADNYIIIPSTGLNSAVFEGCTSIKNVYARYYLSGGIRANAFKGCTSLTTANVSANCASIGESAFEGCTALTTVTGCRYKYTSGGTAYYTTCTIGNKAFKDCTALKYFGSSTTYAYLGGNGNTHNFTAVTSIGDNAFENCTSFTTAYFHRVNSIGANAFKGCTGLQYTYVVKADGSYNALKSGDTDIELLTLGESVFEGCTKLARFYYVSFSLDPDDNTKLVSTYQPNTLFTTIPARAFYGCEKLSIIGGTGAASTTTTSTSLYGGACFPNVTAIGESAFEGCAALSLVLNLNTSAPTIGANAFKNCEKLTRFGTRNNTIEVFGASVGANAFQNCALPTTLYLGQDLTNIGASAFEGCAALATIWMYRMEDAPSVGEDAFKDIVSTAIFLLAPTNSYTKVSNYALDNTWKTFFNGTKATYTLGAYVNKSKQYGTVSCEVPLHFAYTSTANIYKVKATSQTLAALEAVSSRKLPANMGAIVEMAADGDAFKASTQVKVLFDESASADDFSGNKLVANVTENTDFKGQEGGKYNLILVDGEFVKANDGTLAGGLAYLPVALNSADAKLSLTFDGEVTGIETVENEAQNVENNVWYTPQGVRVAQPTKGVYIHNGKKVMVK